MSSYSELTLGAFHLGSERNDVDPNIMAIFRESDKRITSVDRSQPELLRKYVEDDYDEDDPVTIVQYACSAKVARDRLDLMGFTRSVAEASFSQGLQEKIDSYDRPIPRSLKDSYEEKIQFLRTLTVRDWMAGMRHIWQHQLKEQIRYDADCSDYTPLLRYMLCGREGWYGFPGYDYRHFIRLALDVCTDSDELNYDLTALVCGGYFDEADDMVRYASEIMSADFAIHRKLIVLTEGPTDKWILERSLNVLYPHLSEYFHFFDFKENKVGGGAGELANIVKAFAAAGIINRIIAVFDNDTAGQAALQALSSISLPENIVTQKYPDIETAINYPTLGPTGAVSMDVNGLAGSIEMYLGEDILRIGDGELMPVQWTGYEMKLRKYQGEIQRKSELQKQFSLKLQTCEADASKVNSFDWDGMRAIIQTLCTAFHDKDAKDILEEQAALHADVP